MAHIKQKYKWIDDFDGKKLNLPTAVPLAINLVESQSSEKIAKGHSQSDVILPFAASECFTASIVDVKQLASNDDCVDVKTVYELLLRIPNSSIIYQPGDTIGILPENGDSVIHDILNRSADLKSMSLTPISLKINEVNGTAKKAPKIPSHLPRGTTTIYKLLKESVELNAIPKKLMLNALIQHDCLSDPLEKRFLEIIASREGSALYATEILQTQKTFFALFNELKSLAFTPKTIPLLFEHLPRLMPRIYSIASSALAMKSLREHERNSTILRIIFSVMEPPGVTTRMLEQRIFKYQVEHTLTLDSVDETVNVYLRQSNRFRLSDEDYDRPLALMAIGTGIAPFIGFLEHRREQKKKLNRKSGDVWLFFGCRRQTNQLCSTEIDEFLRSKVLTKFSQAFSRDIGSEFRYVQDQVKAKAHELVQFLLRDGEHATKTFICGNKKMIQDVRNAIEESIAKEHNVDVEEAKVIINELIKNGRFIEDIWI